MNQTIEDQSLTPDQRIWRWRILVSTYFAYAGFYLVRKVFAICKTTLADEYGFGFDGVANIWPGDRHLQVECAGPVDERGLCRADAGYLSALGDRTQIEYAGSKQQGE